MRFVGHSEAKQAINVFTSAVIRGKGTGWDVSHKMLSKIWWSIMFRAKQKQSIKEKG